MDPAILNSYDEKVHHVEEHIERTASQESYDARINVFTPAEQRKIIHRIDRRLILTLGLMYCVSLMDRTNLGLAAIGGMAVDLDLIGNRYSLITLIFFIPYILFQPPATVVLRKVGPRKFLSLITLLWGIIMLSFGFVKQWYALMPLRVLLGIFEAGFFPGCAYLLSCWYPRYDLQKRNAVFYLIGSMASAFAGILAYGFLQMNGLGSGSGLGLHYGPTAADPTAPSGIESGIASWRWIFIMEGSLTAFVSVIGYWMIVDFPEDAFHSWRFLNEKEADFIVARIELDRRDAIPEPFVLKKYLANALDLKIWAFASLFMLSTTNTYAIAYFLPIILNDGMGFSLAASECLVAPPYVAAAIVMFIWAYLGDKYHIRSPFILVNGILGLIGLPLLGFAKSNAVRYFGVFLAVIAGNANIPCVLTYQANNVRGQWKRAFSSATLVGFGGIGGIIGSTVFREQDKPAYHPGIMATMIANALIVVITLALTVKFKRANSKAAAGGPLIEGLEGFRHTL